MATQLIYRLVDDSDEEAGQYRRLLETAGKRKLRVEVEPVRSDVRGYLPLLQDKHTGGFILDQVLNDNDAADYTGLELADFLRAIDSRLPLFILTNYASPDLEATGRSVEEVIAKDDIREHTGTYVARMLRRLGEYDDALEQRQKRFRILIDRQLKRRLTPKEQAELEALRMEIERPTTFIAEEQEKIWQSHALYDEKLISKLDDALSAISTVGRTKPKRPRSPKQRKRQTKKRQVSRRGR